MTKDNYKDALRAKIDAVMQETHEGDLTWDERVDKITDMVFAECSPAPMKWIKHGRARTWVSGEYFIQEIGHRYQYALYIDGVGRITDLAGRVACQEKAQKHTNQTHWAGTKLAKGMKL